MRCAPQSAGISVHGHAPHLLAVGLEEVVVEPPAEAATRRSPRAWSWSFGGLDPHPQVRQPRTAPPRPGRGSSARSSARSGSRRACRGSRCGSCRGRRRKSSGPRISNQRSSTGFTLVKKRWPPMSKRQPSRIDGAADAADDRVGLEHRRRDAALGEHVGGGEPGRARRRSRRRRRPPVRPRRRRSRSCRSSSRVRFSWLRAAAGDGGQQSIRGRARTATDWVIVTTLCIGSGPDVP